MKRSNGNIDQSESLSLSSHKGTQESREPCEICGSVGIVGSVMICFKCRETREHTYCAMVLLLNVPPIWLCEECRFSSGDLMGSETGVADCSSNPKSTNNSTEEDHETAKRLRTNDMEKVVDGKISLPVILQASTSDSSYEISASINSVIHPVAKEASSEFHKTSQDKKQHQPSQGSRKRRRTFRLMGKHISPSPAQETVISDENASPKCNGQKQNPFSNTRFDSNSNGKS